MSRGPPLTLMHLFFPLTTAITTRPEIPYTTIATQISVPQFPSPDEKLFQKQTVNRNGCKSILFLEPSKLLLPSNYQHSTPATPFSSPENPRGRRKTGASGSEFQKTNQPTKQNQDVHRQPPCPMSIRDK